MKILGNIRVLELGSFITAPYAAMLLAEMGADTIKVERPGAADPFRSHTETSNSPFFLAYNRNKRAISLDYAKPAGLKALHELVKTADVLIINARPGVTEKIGIDVATLQAINPRLVYCSITGFGNSGPYSKRPAFDGVGQTLSGIMSRFHQSDDPRVAGMAMSDSLTGLYACMGVLGALFEREHTGKGRHVEVNMVETGMSFSIEPLAHYLVLGEDQPFWFRGAASQAYILKCKDGKRIGLHMSSPQKFWEGLARATERPDLLERFATRKAKVDGYEELGKELAKTFATRTRDEWMPLLEANDVPFAPERLLAELEHDPQVQHLGTFNEVHHPERGTYRGINRPVRFDGDNRSAFLPPPAEGEHTDEILREAGYDDEGIAALRAAGLV